MKQTGKIKAAALILLAASISFAGCLAKSREVRYDADMPEICRQMLNACFGETYILSEGTEREEHFSDELENTDFTSYYEEWRLVYEDANGQECSFVFNNRCGEAQAREHMEETVKNYFSSLIRQHYGQNFWNRTLDLIPGCNQDDSVLYFQPYRLFSIPDIPKTSVMFDERLHYSLTEHIFFPRLRYDEVFREFPYILNMYLYVTYGETEETGRTAQRRETENRLRKMTDEMIRYTDGSLNAVIYVTMMDENGYADGFSLAVLNGAYYADGPGTAYEIALHENFFGPVIFR